VPTPHKSRQNTWTLLFTRARACGWRCSQHLEAVGTLNVQLALALSQLAFVLSQLAFVLSQLAFVLSQLAFVLSQLALVLSQLAFVLSQLALVLSQLALVLSGRCTAAARFGPRTGAEACCAGPLKTVASHIYVLLPATVPVYQAHL
jgi:hypothetical protein